MSNPASRSMPVKSSDRIQVVDVLRGFAILGILLFNMKGFSGQSFFAGSWDEPLDRAIVILLDFLVQAKFYSLFSFLFGWGMAVQMRRAEDKGINFFPVYFRRLVILFVFGSLHSVFLWTGDILLMYAVIGILMLLIFRNSSPKTLLAASGLLLLSAIIMTLPGGIMDSTREWCLSLSQCWTPDPPLSTSLYATGTYWQVTQLRFQDTFGDIRWFPCYMGNVFAMMLLGLYTGKRKLFANLDQHKILFRQVMWIGLAVGCVLNGIFTYVSTKPFESEYFSLIRVGSRTLGAPALTLFYITGITLLFQHQSWKERLAPLAYVGRMALTNYITHSLLLTFFFYGYGLGLYGSTDPSFGLLLTLVVFRSQIQLSKWWFEHYRFGPLEWLWRTLTYNMRLPISMKAKLDALADPASSPQRKRQYFLAAVLIVVIPLVILLISEISSQPDQGVTEDPALGITADPESAELEISGEEEVYEQFSAAFEFLNREESNAFQDNQDLLGLARSFNAKSALEHVEILSSEYYQGRYSGTTENLEAANYISEKFEEYGLVPVGDNGDYSQFFLLNSLVLDDMPVLTIANAGETTHAGYQLHQDLVPVLGHYAGAGQGEGSVVWAVDCSVQDFHELDVVGKIIFCRTGNIQEQARLAAKNGAAGLLLYTSQEVQPPGLRAALSDAWIPDPIPVIQIYDGPASALLSDSSYSLNDLSILYEPFEIQSRVQLEVKASPPCRNDLCEGQNILGLLPGWDPEYADQVIVISASLDGPGSTPDGQYWPGANQNASSLGVLLEIARSWHEQDYRPRMTVLFAAWDAQEQGSQGVQYFLKNSIYNLDNTLAVIHLGGVGSGGEILQINGASLPGKIEAAAAVIGLEASRAEGNSTMAGLFQEIRIPFLELQWDGAEALANQPADAAELIQVERLDQAGEISGLLATQLSDILPGIQELLSRRCEAITENDLAAFLETSVVDRAEEDTHWFNEIQTLDLVGCDVILNNLLSTASTARADVAIILNYPAESDEDTNNISIRTAARFQQDQNGWLWAGPDTVNSETISAGKIKVTVQHPANDTQDYSEIGRFALDEYQRITRLLSLPAVLNGQIIIFPNRDTMIGETTPLQATSYQDWVGINTLKFSYNPIDDQDSFKTAIAHLLLKNAGIPEGSFPWLWEGLPIILEHEQDQIVLQSGGLNQFHEQLQAGNLSSSSLTSWAAVEYLHQGLGWTGIGQLIDTLGKVCQDNGCDTEPGADQALVSSLGMDQETFSTVWKEHWSDHLDQVQAKLDGILIQRAEAALNKDEAAFLNTVDPEIPNLIEEERDWFADFEQYPPEYFRLTGKPITIMDDGSLLAQVTMEYKLESVTEPWGRSSLPLEILFSAENGEVRWAGLKLESVRDGNIQVRFPEGKEEQALIVLENVGVYYSQLADSFQITNPSPLTINLYDKRTIYRASISPSYPAPDWAPGWSAPGHSIKFLIDNNEDEVIDQHTLVRHLARELLSQIGVQHEWLLNGLSIYLSSDVAGGILQQKSAASLLTLNSYFLHEKDFDLDPYPDLDRISKNDYYVALTQAWDSVRFLSEQYGVDALLELMAYNQQSSDLDQAMINATGLSMAEFSTTWKESFNRGHLPPEYLETSQAFDPDQAGRHIDFLVSPELAGRQAGSEGAGLAAEYIKNKFNEYGLIAEEQIFQIQYQTYLDKPGLALTINSSIEEFTFREDFLVLQSVNIPNGLSGELVWIADSDYTDMNLSGKIAVRKPDQAINEEINNARESGAAALILIGEKNRAEDLLARYPFPGIPAEDDFPVVELTRSGYDRLLELTGLNPAILNFSHPAINLNANAAIRIAISPSTAMETSNIIGVLPGKNPLLQDEVVLLGAHYDHVGDEVGVLYSGSNDNASGVAVMLEIARLWQVAGYQPERTVLFIAWGAQELGEAGSKYYLSNPLYPLENTVATLQLDSIGGGKGYYLEAFGGRDENGLLLFSILKAGNLADTRLTITEKIGTSMPSAEWLFSPGYLFGSSRTSGTSDDLPFRQAGIPTLLLRWTDPSEKNLPDTLADEVLPERLATSGITISATLMILAR